MRDANTTLTIDLLTQPLSVCRLHQSAPVPDWATRAPFFSVTRTSDELSIVCDTAHLPAASAGIIARDDGWRALRLAGPFAFTEVGVLLRVAAPLASAGVSILPIATYDTDYVLVREAQLGAAIGALREAGCLVNSGRIVG